MLIALLLTAIVVLVGVWVIWPQSQRGLAPGWTF